MKIGVHTFEVDAHSQKEDEKNNLENKDVIVSELFIALISQPRMTKGGALSQIKIRFGACADCQTSI